jgi:hypothetical protein
MESNNIETALSIKHILSEDKYIIPIYQRNYAWERAEIVQLINDINDSFKQNTNCYYLGSLVCFKRSDNIFELIDGQQRHTTLTLINLVLKSFLKDKLITKINLDFDARPNNNSYLNLLLNTENIEEAVINNSEKKVVSFISAIQFICEELRQVAGQDIKKFSEYFYNNVMLFRVEVPLDTDLNHYFEIMNNRGEQLEKHEILKSLLMAKIEGVNKSEKQAVFGKIWDSCSDMTDYIYNTISHQNELRNKIFQSGELNFQNFESVFQILNDGKKEIEEGKNITAILNSENENYQPKSISISEKYKSIIDFPNFLLQVLKFHLKNIEISFDDKNLLREFKKQEIQPEKFIFNLLKFRTLFDKFIIKQDLSSSNENENWSIRTFKNDCIVSTFENHDLELMMIQTMLHYSNPSNNYKNWLFEILEEINTKKEYNAILLKCNQISKDKFSSTKLSYPSITTFNLYYLDFLIWKEYNLKIKSENKNSFEKNSLLDKINSKRNLFNTFKFRQLNSKEHLFPQSKKEMINSEKKDEVLNSLGNLCLISNAENSSANNNSAFDKKYYYGDKNTSLKRLVMFESFENETWNTEQIKEHHKEMLDLLNSYLA